MIRRIGRRKFNIYALDIESHNDINSIKNKETSVWLGCFINEESKVEEEDSYFYSFEEFLDKLEGLCTKKRTHKTRPCNNYCIYIYNLSFEWSFLLPVLLSRGFTFRENIADNDSYCYNSVTTKTCSSVWQVELKFSEKSGKVLFRDLSKIYGGGLGKVAKAFGLETQKGEIDYRLDRRFNHIVTKEEKEYCFKDTRILMEILMIMDKRDDKFFWKSMSMASYSMLMMLKEGYPRKTKPYLEYRKDYPVLPIEEQEFLRKSVSGGICYAPKGYQFKEINQKICHVDAHSMHPSSAYLHRYPYGKGTYGLGKPSHPNKIACCHIKVSYDDVRIHSVIKLIGIDAIEDMHLYVWDFEIPTMQKCYINLEIEYIDYYEYDLKVLPWRRYYKLCYYRRLEAKERGDEFNKLFYKLLLNSSYGKALEKGHATFLENTIMEDGTINSIVHDKVKSEEQSQEDFDLKLMTAKYTYLPYGSCIPAWSRVSLIEHALKVGWEYVTYFDTDSIFFIWNDETKGRFYNSFNLKDELGGWAIEEFIDRAQFSAPKRYKTETDGHATFKMGGFNLDKYKEEIGKDELDFCEVNIISSKWEVQRAFRCKGGTIIDFQEKEVKIPDKYLHIYEKNVNINNGD